MAKTRAKYVAYWFFFCPQMQSKVYLCRDFERQLCVKLVCLLNEYIDVKQIVWKIRPQIKWEIKVLLGIRKIAHMHEQKKTRYLPNERVNERNLKYLECSQQVSSSSWFLMTFQRSRFYELMWICILISIDMVFVSVRVYLCVYEYLKPTTIWCFVSFVSLFSLLVSFGFFPLFSVSKIRVKYAACAVELFAWKWI